MKWRYLMLPIWKSKHRQHKSSHIWFCHRAVNVAHLLNCLVYLLAIWQRVVFLVSTHHKPCSAVYQVNGGRSANPASRLCRHLILKCKGYWFGSSAQGKSIIIMYFNAIIFHLTYITYIYMGWLCITIFSLFYGTQNLAFFQGVPIC